MSNKTPKKLLEEIGSEPNTPPPKPTRSYSKLLLALAMLAFGGWLLWYGIRNVTDDRQILVAPQGRIQIEVADDDYERYTGLSDRAFIEGGLLFEYPESSEDHCLTMRRMFFPIDMVWLDNDKKVITVEESVSPDTFPEVFCPDKSARYALELGSGEADRLGIRVGSQLVF